MTGGRMAISVKTAPIKQKLGSVGRGIFFPARWAVAPGGPGKVETRDNML